MPSQAFEISYKDARFSGYYSVNVFRTGSFSLAVDFVDISERKRIEDAVRNERDFSTSLVQSSPVFYVAIRADGSIVMANNAMLSAVGYTQQEVSGADYISKFCIPEQRDKVSGIFKRIVIENKMDLSESFVVAKDGRRLLVEWRGVPVFKGGDLDFFFGVGIDITRRKEAEEEIKKLNSELEMRVADRTRQLENGIRNSRHSAIPYPMTACPLRLPLTGSAGVIRGLFRQNWMRKAGIISAGCARREPAYGQLLTICFAFKGDQARYGPCEGRFKFYFSFYNR
jgi:PAS domain S-box-containing protein